MEGRVEIVVHFGDARLLELDASDAKELQELLNDLFPVVTPVTWYPTYPDPYPIVYPDQDSTTPAAPEGV